MKYLSETSTKELLKQIDFLIEEYQLSKTNKEGYLKLRDYYNNENNSPIVFYVLVCYAFNYQIRFNKNGEYNMPFGKDRSSFNPSLRQKFIDFVNELHKKNYRFGCNSFDKLSLDNLTNDDFVYCDPPYLNSVASYNENGGWTEEDEKKLLDLLDELNDKGVKFALSNNLKYDNEILGKWKERYNVHYLNINYSNCNYQKIDKSKDVEVLITNY